MVFYYFSKGRVIPDSRELFVKKVMSPSFLVTPDGRALPPAREWVNSPRGGCVAIDDVRLVVCIGASLAGVRVSCILSVREDGRSGSTEKCHSETQGGYVLCTPKVISTPPGGQDLSKRW